MLRQAGCGESTHQLMKQYTRENMLLWAHPKHMCAQNQLPCLQILALDRHTRCHLLEVPRLQPCHKLGGLCSGQHGAIAGASVFECQSLLLLDQTPACLCLSLCNLAPRCLCDRWAIEKKKTQHYKWTGIYRQLFTRLLYVAVAFLL